MTMEVGEEHPSRGWDGIVPGSFSNCNYVSYRGPPGLLPVAP